MAVQSRAEKHAWYRSTIRLAAFSSRGAGGRSSSKRASAASRSASSKISQRYQVAVDSRNVDHSPLGVEAFWRRPIRRIGEDCSELLRRCTASMWVRSLA